MPRRIHNGRSRDMYPERLHLSWRLQALLPHGQAWQVGQAGGQAPPVLTPASLSDSEHTKERTACPS